MTVVVIRISVDGYPMLEVNEDLDEGGGGRDPAGEGGGGDLDEGATALLDPIYSLSSQGAKRVAMGTVVVTLKVTAAGTWTVRSPPPVQGRYPYQYELPFEISDMSFCTHSVSSRQVYLFIGQAKDKHTLGENSAFIATAVS